MAGDWIKMEVNLPDKPEVWQIAGALSIDPDAVVGKLLRVWAWFDAHTEDGNAVGVSYPLIDRITGVAGFAEAMAFAGWLVQNGHALSCPRFDRHNGKTAKNRALTNERVGKHRKAQREGNAEGNAASNADTVTKTVSREEKRREDKKPPKAPQGACPGFDEFWSAYPRKDGKAAALKAFTKLSPDEALQARIRKAIEAAKASEAWKRDGGQYIPHGSTWINGQRWEDAGVEEAEDEHESTDAYLARIKAEEAAERARLAGSRGPSSPELAAKLAQLTGRMTQ